MIAALPLSVSAAGEYVPGNPRWSGYQNQVQWDRPAGAASGDSFEYEAQLLLGDDVVESKAVEIDTYLFFTNDVVTRPQEEYTIRVRARWIMIVGDPDGQYMVADVGEAEPPHEHSYTQKHDAAQHWQACSCGESAFQRCTGLTDITIPDGVTSIRSRAFNGCEKLGSITFTGNTAPELEADDVFDECAALTAIHVPCGADGYTAANGWPEDKVQHEHVWAEDWTSDGTHHWKACTAEGCAEKDQYGVHQIANGVCTVCKAEVETSGVQTYAVKVNGITVTSANASDILGDADGDGATAYYDPAANTLTLDNAQLTSSGYGAVWAQEENFTLVLKGENQITGEGDFPHSAVYSHGAMTVKGNGSLTTSGTYFGLFGNNTITIEDGASVDLTADFSSDEQDQPYAAVRAIGGLTVDGATLNAKNNATQDASFGTPGINTDLTAINGAKVNISSVNDHGICGDVIVSGAGTVVNASSASGEHYGIFAGQEDIFGELGGDQKGIFTISDGAVVTASGGKGAMRWKPDLSGYTDPVVAAGDSAAAEEIIGDPAGTEYQNEKYVQVRSSLEPVEPTEPTDPTDPTTPTDPTEPTDPAKPEQQGKASAEKIDLARRTIFEMVEEGEKVTIPKLIAKTGLSRGFFYKNPMVRQALDKALEQQVGMIDPRRSVLDMAMDNEIVALHERIRELQQENQRLRAENEKMQKALSRRNDKLLRNL